MEVGKCDLFLTPPRLQPTTLAVPILSFLFTYLFIFYRMKASGQESSADSLLYSCVFAIQNITMKRSLSFYRNSLVFKHGNKPEYVLHFTFHDPECAFM